MRSEGPPGPGPPGRQLEPSSALFSPGASPGHSCDVRSRLRPGLLVLFAPLSLPERQRVATQFWIVGKLTPGTFLPSDPGQTGPGVKSAGRWLLPWG